MWEVFIVSVLGSVLGVVGGIGYVKVMIYGLLIWWCDVIVIVFFEMYFLVFLFFVGFLCGVLVFIVIIFMVLWLI